MEQDQLARKEIRVQRVRLDLSVLKGDQELMGFQAMPDLLVSVDQQAKRERMGNLEFPDEMVLQE